MRKILSLVLCAVLSFGMLPTSFAVTEEKIDLGDGFYMVIERPEEGISTYALRNASKDATVYYSDTKVGTMTVTAQFTYSSSGVSVNSKSCTASGANGWSVKDKWTSGTTNQVTGYATFSNGSTSKTAPLSITCDKNGNIT
ncbi:MAG: hypothetical protein Q4C72_04870 [Eubacteriales bacterium]|nr:hypothetical protein [Eubacteriales bacterium]